MNYAGYKMGQTNGMRSITRASEKDTFQITEYVTFRDFFNSFRHFTHSFAVEALLKLTVMVRTKNASKDTPNHAYPFKWTSGDLTNALNPYGVTLMGVARRPQSTRPLA